MKLIKGILFVTLLLSASSFLFAAEEKYLSIDAKVSYVSKYMWRGFDLLGGDPAVQPEVTLVMGETGFYLGAWGSYGVDSKWDIWDEWDFYGGYGFVMFEKDPWELSCDLSYTYFTYPNQPEAVDSQEVAFAIKLPELVKSENISLVPYSTLYYSFGAHSNPDISDQEGWWLKLGMEWEEKWNLLWGLPLSGYVETFCNDGATTQKVDSGFSHVAFGLKTTAEWKGFSFTPSVNYQCILENSVNNNEDEFWYTLSVLRSF